MEKTRVRPDLLLQNEKTNDILSCNGVLTAQEFRARKALGFVALSTGHLSSGKVTKTMSAQLSGEWNCWCKAGYAVVSFHGMATKLNKKS